MTLLAVIFSLLVIFFVGYIFCGLFTGLAMWIAYYVAWFFVILLMLEFLKG